MTHEELIAYGCVLIKAKARFGSAPGYYLDRVWLGSTPQDATEALDIPKPKKRILACVTEKGCYVIYDEDNNPVPVEEAKRRWEAGGLADYNGMLYRLMSLGWDFEKLEAHYTNGGR